MTDRQYFTRGGTALVDALGGAIHHIGNVHRYAREEDRPGKTLFVITTDGYENSSRHYTAKRVREMVKHEQEKYGWEFLFLGANIDAVETAEQYGIGHEYAVDYCSDAEGTALNYEVLSEAITQVRACRTVAPRWKGKVEADYKKRGNK